MQRIRLAPRADWREKAEALGFTFHTMHGQAYWDESSAYAFSLRQVEDDIEDPATGLHAMCLEAVDHVVGSQELMERLGIPAEHRDYVAQSWRDREPSLYGRFDLAYDGAGPAKLLEYNADTPTSVYEAGSFQWLWLEDMQAAGALPCDEPDQFNLLHEKLVDRFRELLPQDEALHFTSFRGHEEDFATVEYLAWIAKEAGLVAHYAPLDAIGLTATGQFADEEARVIGTLFKLYPWEDIFLDDFAQHVAGAHCRFLEPAWKSLLSNKGILPVLWRLFEGHPNLLPAFFADEMQGSNALFERARAEIERGHVVKPIFSREGASIEIVERGVTTDASAHRDYDRHPAVVQAYAPLPVFEGAHPVIGAWIVGETCVGMGIREDDSRITQDLSRFKPHFIQS